jgi:hypothetical protein
MPKAGIAESGQHLVGKIEFLKKGLGQKKEWNITGEGKRI